MTIAASFTPKPAILSFAITHELLTMRLFLDSLANNNFRMKYEDIIDMPHHQSDKHPKMSMRNRAAQFSPFAALNGYNEAIKEVG